MLIDKKEIIEGRGGYRSWQLSQRGFQRRRNRRKLLRATVKYVLAGAVLVAVTVALTGLWGSRGKGQQAPQVSASVSGTVDGPEPDATAVMLEKAQVRTLLAGESLVNRRRRSFQVDTGSGRFLVETSLDPSLQEYLMGKLDREHSRYVGVVAMDPASGKVLAMVGYNRVDAAQDPCSRVLYPAASIFKIVTAAAAIEKLGLNSGSTLRYNGRKHTRYKSQLKDRNNRYTRHVTLRDSFAQSINPIFGKLGASYLKGDALEAYARKFGFGQAVAFELPVTPSTLIVSDKPYQWAEVASGFNKTTRITPLHGAMIVSAVVNGGRLPEPTVVERVVDAGGKTIYSSREAFTGRVISEQTSRIMRQLMVTTIKKGTARKMFRGYSRDKVLSKLTLGGKTGSINNDPRYDWFVGFAREKGGGRSLVVSAVVAHHKLIGTRAGQYARMAMKLYFGDYFARRPPASAKRSG
jgi:cell division protein FtsI/penicillin-binding protein 2